MNGGEERVEERKGESEGLRVRGETNTRGVERESERRDCYEWRGRGEERQVRKLLLRPLWWQMPLRNE